MVMSRWSLIGCVFDTSPSDLSKLNLGDQTFLFLGTSGHLHSFIEVSLLANTDASISAISGQATSLCLQCPCDAHFVHRTIDAVS